MVGKWWEKSWEKPDKYPIGAMTVVAFPIPTSFFPRFWEVGKMGLEAGILLGKGWEK